MLTDQDLRELLNYQASSPVLSIYLSTEPADGNAEMHRLRLRSMLKEVDLPDDLEAVLRYFDHQHDWIGKSVVVFSHAASGFFRAYSFAVPIASRVRVNDRPFVKPLADLYDSYGGYGVVLVDKQSARLFYFHLGELREQEGMKGEEVRHTKRGGASAFPGRRGGVAGVTGYAEEVAERNIKEVVEAATRFFKENTVRRVLIGGTEENVAIFRNQLPKAWQSLVVGSFPVSMTATSSEVLERAMQIGKAAEEHREADLVEKVITAAAKGRGGAVGLDDTLKAVHEGRVQTLIIENQYRSAGYLCQSCGYLSAVELEKCPYCGGSCKKIKDVVETAVRQVMHGGGDVEVLHPQVGSQKNFQIGAQLRY